MITEVKVNQDYFFDGAYYMQTEMCMYRFQLNEQGLIESYIKYGFSTWVVVVPQAVSINTNGITDNNLFIYVLPN